jgi:RimJ/RimL family protein N-acetyltransferase
MGIGEMFFNLLKEYAQAEQCQRITWQVLEWNEPAINFYKKIGAKFDDEWVNGFLEIK